MSVSQSTFPLLGKVRSTNGGMAYRQFETLANLLKQIDMNGDGHVVCSQDMCGVRGAVMHLELLKAICSALMVYKSCDF